MQIRPARKEEARLIAGFYRLSSDGVADYVWSLQAAAGEDLLDVGERRYAREGTPFSYENCTLVDVDGEVAAMLVAFPLFVDPDYRESDPVLRPYMTLEEDNSYYICGIAVKENFRRRGIARTLMTKAEQDARDKGFSKLSLICFEENRPALNFYLGLGYGEVMRETVVPHPLIHHQGEALLLVKQLD